jgi:hypothetical protein
VWDTPADEITDFYARAMTERGWRLVQRKKREGTNPQRTEVCTTKFERETSSGTTQQVRCQVLWFPKRPEDVWKSHRDHEIAQVSLALSDPTQTF